jgi:hypothetical protein
MKKPILALTLLLNLLCLLALSSCKDDNDGISADIHSPITGYWQIAGTSIETGADINGDGAVEGIAVHDDGTVSEWQYTQATEDPFKLGYKTGTWTIDGNHYVMLLSKGNNKHYTVTVAGNDNEKMYLAYNGKTSVIPFYRLQHLPGDGDSMMEMMAQMKFSGIQMSDLAGYWELTTNDNPNGVGNGIYIDEQGNVSNVTQISGAFNYNEIDYHSGKVNTSDGHLVFPYSGTNFYLYAASKDIILATADGQKIEKFIRKDTPKEVTRIEEIVNSKVPEQLIGIWETIHYQILADGQPLIDEDIIPSSYVSTYKKLSFSSNHVVNEYSTYDTDYHTSNYFMVDGKNLLTSSSLSGLVNADYDYVKTEHIEFISDSEMTLTHDNGGSQTTIYTYKKIQ